MQLIANTKVVVNDMGSSDTEYTTTTNGVNMKLYNRCRIELHLVQSGAGTATVTLKQGSTSTVNTALAFAEYWENEAGLNTDTLTKVTATTQTAAGAYTGYNLYVFEVKADQLDTDTFGSENTWVRLNVASLGNNTCGMIRYELYEPRYPEGGDAMKTALT